MSFIIGMLSIIVLCSVILLFAMFPIKEYERSKHGKSMKPTNYFDSLFDVYAKSVYDTRPLHEKD
ncbi:hypothetical protein ACFOZ1_08310 [Gracilibacillus marinus]|uniref:DUF3951 domain-containing protein n=1 Tax=Gracilibacillus marinus TaxID=630535 RepID=A0ABV8VW46_9BACI